jgi:hypothetical protein
VGVLIYIITNRVGGFFFLHILSSIYFLFFVIIAILTILRWNLSLVLICIFLLANNIEHFSCIFLTIGISFEKCSDDVSVFSLAYFILLLLRF